MLEGLEIVEINYSDLKEEYSKLRLDAEFYKKEFVQFTKTIKKRDFLKIGQVSFVTDGIHESIDFDKKSDINLISAKSPKENYFDLTSNHHISSKQNQKNPRTELQENDVIISTVGTIGNCAVVRKNILPANSDRHVGIVRIKEKIKPYFLSTFLLSKYGRFQTLRESTGNVQLNLFIYKIKELIIPKLPEVFQTKVEDLCSLAYDNRIESKQTYTKAENILLQEIGLQDFTPSKAPVNIKSFKDSFATSGRLDAEYYQPKYDDYLKLIESYSNGSETIATICNLNIKSFKPEDKKKYNYIELSNVGKTGDINGCTVNFGKELPSRARRKVNTGDVIISSIEGSLQSCALVTKEYDNALCSTGFYVINSDFINSESLLVLFKSELMQNILKQNCSGTILTGLNKDDFLSIKIPKIIKSKQLKIADLIEQSFTLKKQSEHLLKVAKKAVEIAIEENEQIALQFIAKERKKR